MQRHDTKDWLSALEYLETQDDAPEDARESARTIRLQYAAAEALLARQREQLDECSAIANDAQRQLVPDVVSALGSKKAPSVEERVAHLESLNAAKERAVAAHSVARRARDRVAHTVTGGINQGRNDSLFTWIAKRRTSAGHAIGHHDLLPDPVQLIYSRVRATWLTPWDETTGLGNLNRLPLLYEPTWTPQVRGALELIWRLVAEGEVELVPHPNDKKRVPTLLAPSRRFLEVEPAPVLTAAQTKNARGGWLGSGRA